MGTVATEMVTITVAMETDAMEMVTIKTVSLPILETVAMEMVTITTVSLPIL